MGKRGNLGNLIANCWRYGDSSASDGRWTAKMQYLPKYSAVYAIVKHHSTDMIAVSRDGDSVIPLSEGWRSRTDKAGINKVLAGYNVSTNYRTLFPDVYASVGTVSARSVEVEKPEPVKRWVPPITVEDTMI